MPIYEYTCEKCAKDFEKLVFAGDTDPVECPGCGATEVRRQVSCTSMISSSAGGGCSSGTSGFS